MSELNEKVEEPQEQPFDRAPMPDEELQKILEAHRKWVESEGKEGKRADLGGANLQTADLAGASLQEAYLGGANLQGAKLGGVKLQGANLRGAEGLTASQVMAAYDWELAIYSDDFLKNFGLKPDHN